MRSLWSACSETQRGDGTSGFAATVTTAPLTNGHAPAAGYCESAGTSVVPLRGPVDAVPDVCGVGRATAGRLLRWGQARQRARTGRCRRGDVVGAVEQDARPGHHERGCRGGGHHPDLGRTASPTVHVGEPVRRVRAVGARGELAEELGQPVLLWRDHRVSSRAVPAGWLGGRDQLAQTREAPAGVALDRAHRHPHDGGGLVLAEVAVEAQDDGRALLGRQREQGPAQVLGVLVGAHRRRGPLRWAVGQHLAAPGSSPQRRPGVDQHPAHVRVRLVVRADPGPARQRLGVRGLQEVLCGVEVTGEQERQALEPGAAGHHVRVEVLVGHVCLVRSVTWPLVLSVGPTPHTSTGPERLSGCAQALRSSRSRRRSGRPRWPAGRRCPGTPARSPR